MDDKIAVIGLGRLGFPLAVALAHRGFKVIGVDIDPEVIEAVNAHRIPEHICEPGLQEMLDGTENLIGTMDMEAAVFAPISIVMVNTPSRDDGSFSLMHVLTVCQALGVHLQNRDAYHTVIISSTVMPGDCDGPIREALEEASGRKVGKDLGLCCCPEFVALGNILRGFLEPDFVIIGASDIKADFQAQSLYKQFCLNDPPIHNMSLTSAEIAKIGLNVAVVTKMAMAAQLTWLCQRYPGADADAVLAAIGDDSRIGRSYFTKTLWPGGPCFPRDSASFIAAARKVGQPVPVAEGTDAYLWLQIAEMADWLESFGGRIGILGLTYKAGVSVTDDSYGLALADLLRQRGQKVKVCDPHVPETMSLKDIVNTSDVLVVTVGHAEFQALEKMDLRGKIVVDCRGFLDENKISGQYVRQGRGV
jgi:UDPglucose 6-dehydrogenase